MCARGRGLNVDSMCLQFGSGLFTVTFYEPQFSMHQTLFMLQVFYGLLASGKSLDPTYLTVLRLVVFSGMVLNVTSAMLQRNRDTLRIPAAVALGLGPERPASKDGTTSTSIGNRLEAKLK